MIDQHLEKLAFLRGVDRKLELAVVDLEFGRDRLTLLFAGRPCCRLIFEVSNSLMSASRSSSSSSSAKMTFWPAKPTRAASPRTVAPAVIKIIFLRVILTSIGGLLSPHSPA
jgi:hypothetical protein